MQAINGNTTQGDDGFDFNLEPGRDVELGLELRPEQIRMTVAGTLSRTYPLAGRTLGVVAPWAWQPSANGPALAIGSYQSPTRFGPVRLRIPAGV